MDEAISLAIRLLGQSADCLRLRLLVKNRSADKLLLPLPEITGFHFQATSTGEPATWYTRVLISSLGEGMPLKDGVCRSFDFAVWPCDVVERLFGDDPSRHPRWCLGLPPGAYSVAYGLRVDAAYFDPDSHMTLEDLQGYATSVGAIAWQGEVWSNRLQVNRR